MKFSMRLMALFGALAFLATAIAQENTSTNDISEEVSTAITTDANGEESTVTLTSTVTIKTSSSAVEEEEPTTASSNASDEEALKTVTVTASDSESASSADTATSTTQGQPVTSVLTMTQTLVSMQTDPSLSLVTLVTTQTTTMVLGGSPPPVLAPGASDADKDKKKQGLGSRLANWFRKSGTTIKSKTKEAFSTTKRESKRAGEHIEAAWYDTKLRAVQKGVEFLVDYALAIDTWQKIVSAGCDTDDDKAKKPDSQTTALSRDALGVFLRPLKTYQHAQGHVSDKRLASTLVGMMRIVTTKQANRTIEEGDWRPGTMWTSVVRRVDLDAVLTYRDSLFAWYASKTTQPEDTLRQQDAERHNNALNYFKGLQRPRFQRKHHDDDSDKDDGKAAEEEHSVVRDRRWHFRKLIAKALDWDAFEARYFDIVTKVLVQKPDLMVRCRRYLARYLHTGDSAEAYYQDLIGNIKADATTASDGLTSSTDTAATNGAADLASSTANVETVSVTAEVTQTHNLLIKNLRKQRHHHKHHHHHRSAAGRSYNTEWAMLSIPVVVAVMLF